MQKFAFKWFKNLFPPFLGFFLIYYSYINTTAENKNTIYSSILNADYFFVLISVFLGFLSHFIRALRWKNMLSPIGHNIKFRNSLMCVFIAFLSNLGFPRSGEILRSSSISFYEKIPFEKSFGTLITERIIDACLLGLIIVYGSLISASISLSEFSNSYFLIFGVLFVSIFLITKINLNPRISKIVKGLKKGVMSVSKIKNKTIFTLHTLLIWVCYFLMFYLVKFSINETMNLEFEALILAFIAGAITMSLTNGGIGAYPLAIAAVISQYDVSYENALALGWIVWSAQTLMIVFFGILSFIFLPILNK